MPTGQEELTRERRERLKEVKPFFFDIGIKMETLFLSLWCVMDTYFISTGKRLSAEDHRRGCKTIG